MLKQKREQRALGYEVLKRENPINLVVFTIKTRLREGYWKESENATTASKGLQWKKALVN